LNSALRCRLEGVAIGLPSQRVVQAERSYLRWDTAMLQEGLLLEARRLGVALLEATVHGVRAGGPPQLSVGGHTWSPRWVVDATGVGSVFTPRSRPQPRAYQLAYGVWVRGGRPQDERSFLMDLRADSGAPRSFLYALREAEDVWFYQETLLATEDVSALGLLRRRLLERLERRHPGFEVLDEERCCIPLDTGLPAAPSAATQGILALGAAAGTTNPISGYQLMRGLRQANLLAEGFVSQCSEQELSERLWTPAQRATFGLLSAALESYLRLDSAHAADFFEAVFTLPEPEWRGLLTGELSARELSASLWRVFQRAEPSLKVGLLRGLVPLGGALLRATSLGLHHPSSNPRSSNPSA